MYSTHFFYILLRARTLVHLLLKEVMVTSRPRTRARTKPTIFTQADKEE